ncbi:hypothetical protein AYI68_g699 [Smittium mucronatum]|uniref:Uncharacterized protein n=1 Tax=Smittium mucronatum TaxID=133383 RepID=A0A1R0H7K4_9FUNG|nr:hypothetical protein AYI68_g699 [Smittium mucronatum]
MIIKAKSLKSVLSQTLTADVVMCARDGVLLSEAHSPNFSMELDLSTDSPHLLLQKTPEASELTNSLIQNPLSLPSDSNKGLVSNYNSFETYESSSRVNTPVISVNDANFSSFKDSREPSIESYSKNQLTTSTSESIKSYLAIIATLWTRYERLNSFVGAYNDTEEPSFDHQIDNDLDVLSIESMSQKTIIMSFHQHRLLLLGSPSIPLGLLKAKVNFFSFLPSTHFYFSFS